jgi:hypothetical protein
MRVPADKSDAIQEDGTDAAAKSAVRLALILTFSILGVAGAYYVALYAIAH